MNIGELVVQLTADPSGIVRGTDRAERSLGGLKGAAMKLGGALAGAFAAKEVLAFGVDSIRTFGEAEAVWNRLAGTLDTAGVSFDSVAGEIEGAAAQMQKLTTVGDEDFAETLQTLVRISGDYAGSLQHVQTVADVAAGAQVDLNTAAQLVGKVMAGETGTLKRYGIVVEEGADAMAVLQARFKGMAENEAQTLQGQTTQLTNAWGDFKEAIGAALAGASGGVGILGQVTAAVQSLTAWVEKNGHQLQTLANAFVTVATFAVQQIAIIIEGFGHFTNAVTSTVDLVQAAFGRLTATFERVRSGVASVTETFRVMYDRVVGNSYVPDMVDGIEREFARLNAVMVQPAAAAAGKVNGIFAGIKGPGGLGGLLGGVGGIGGILASLNPATMITSMAVGMLSNAMRGVIQKGFSWIGEKIFGKKKPTTPSSAKQAGESRSASALNAVSGYKLDAARYAATQGRSTAVAVNINTSGDGRETYRAFHRELDQRTRGAGAEARGLFLSLPAPV